MVVLDEADLRARVTSACQQQWPSARIGALEPLPGGVSSLTFATVIEASERTDRPVQPVVLKVAPPGLAPVRNRDVLRQARILHALAPMDGVPVPAVVVEQDGAPPFFAMERVPGQAYEPLVDVSPDPPAAAVVTQRFLAAARTLTAMHDLDVEELGLGDEPPTFVAAELERWRQLLATVDPAIAPGHAELYDRLAASLPEPSRPVLVHGDYRLANMLFDGTRLAAIIDWEIWSVGDQRADLAWLLLNTDPQHRFTRHRSAVEEASGRGVPSIAAVLEAYYGKTVDDVPGLDWFQAFSHYKTAATLSVFIKRNRRRDDPDPALLVAADSMPDLMARGHAILDSCERGVPWRGAARG